MRSERERRPLELEAEGYLGFLKIGARAGRAPKRKSRDERGLRTTETPESGLGLHPKKVRRKNKIPIRIPLSTACSRTPPGRQKDMSHPQDV